MVPPNVPEEIVEVQVLTVVLLTDRLPNVPRVVKLDFVTPLFNVSLVNVLAAAVTVISADPLNATPLIFLDVVNVAADPLVF